ATENSDDGDGTVDNDDIDGDYDLRRAAVAQLLVDSVGSGRLEGAVASVGAEGQPWDYVAVMQEGDTTLGFKMQFDRAETIAVNVVQPGGAAERCGVAVGDCLVTVAGHEVKSLGKKATISALRSGQRPLELGFKRAGPPASKSFVAEASRAAPGAAAARGGGAASGEPSAAARAWWASSSRGGAAPDAGGGFGMPAARTTASPLAAMSAASAYGPELRCIGVGPPLLFI
ncbi:unnamed protein product, partial [Prorocentrum cordatum]